MNWTLAVQIAQVFATILSGIGIIVSLYIGLKTLREIHSERVYRARPRLIFDRGGQVVKCGLEEVEGIMGIDPESSNEFSKCKPPGAKSCVPKSFWDRLLNHGYGSALNVTITLLAKKIHKAGEDFLVDNEKKSEFPYAADLNRFPATPSNIEPGKSGKFIRIPTPIFVDYSGQLTGMECVVIIGYEDIYGHKYQTKQELHVSIDRKGDEADVTLTFGEEIL